MLCVVIHCGELGYDSGVTLLTLDCENLFEMGSKKVIFMFVGHCSLIQGCQTCEYRPLDLCVVLHCREYGISFLVLFVIITICAHCRGKQQQHSLVLYC